MNMVPWTDPQLDKVTLLDLTLDITSNAWLVTQCEGQLKDGTRVMVKLPFWRLPRYGLRRMITRYAKEDGVYAKGLGIFDAIK